MNSQFESKKDYLNNQSTFNPPHGLDYQPINKYSSIKGIYSSSSPNYNIHPTSGYVAPPSTQGLNKF